MHWVYILKCISDGKSPFYYVGETTRLYSRFWEHTNGKGAINTQVYAPESILAIYNVQNIQDFIEYERYVCNTVCNYYKYSRRSLDHFGERKDQPLTHYHAETYIAECLMKHSGNVRGGKYTRFDVEYELPDISTISLPLCHCKLPCDIRKKDDGTIYFRCPKKNIWDEMRNNVTVADEHACKFYQPYNDNKIKQLAEKLRLTVKQSQWLWDIPKGQYEFCLGGCGKEYDSDNCVCSSLNLCYTCFTEAELRMKIKQQYGPDNTVCLI